MSFTFPLCDKYVFASVLVALFSPVTLAALQISNFNPTHVLLKTGAFETAPAGTLSQNECRCYEVGKNDRAYQIHNELLLNVITKESSGYCDERFNAEINSA